MKITLIGLGAEEGDLSLKADEALKNAAKIFARSAHMCAYSSVEKYGAEPLDNLFGSSRIFRPRSTPF